MERVGMMVNYEATQNGKPVIGQLNFVARVADSTKGYDLSIRAQRAVARRLRVKLSDVKIVGVLSY
jgi:hypothetical protein